MSSNSSDIKIKSEPKWQAIGSLIFGVISILANAHNIIWFGKLSMQFGGRGLGWLSWLGTIDLALSNIGWLLLIGGWSFAAVGIVLGIIGLKYIKKKLAITGLVLSLVAFVSYAFLYSMASGTSTG